MTAVYCIVKFIEEKSASMAWVCCIRLNGGFRATEVSSRRWKDAGTLMGSMARLSTAIVITSKNAGVVFAEKSVGDGIYIKPTETKWTFAPMGRQHGKILKPTTQFSCRIR